MVRLRDGGSDCDHIICKFLSANPNLHTMILYRTLHVFQNILIRNNANITKIYETHIQQTQMTQNTL